MSIELRDFFAAHAASALLVGDTRPDEIAKRAYDVAEALLAEREQRGRDAEREAIHAEEAPAWAGPSSDFEREGLLDEPAPMSDREAELDPSWDDRAYDPRWEAEPHWSGKDEGEPSSERPGLRSTRPPSPAEDKRHRSA